MSGAIGNFLCPKRSVKRTLQTSVFHSELQTAHRLIHVHESIGLVTLVHAGSIIVSDDSGVADWLVVIVAFQQSPHLTSSIIL